MPFPFWLSCRESCFVYFKVRGISTLSYSLSYYDLGTVFSVTISSLMKYFVSDIWTEERPTKWLYLLVRKIKARYFVELNIKSKMFRKLTYRNQYQAKKIFKITSKTNFTRSLKTIQSQNILRLWLNYFQFRLPPTQHMWVCSLSICRFYNYFVNIETWWKY